MSKRTIVLFVICIVSLTMMSCSTSRPTAVVPSAHILTTDLVGAGYIITDTLLSQLRASIQPNDPLLVASFVNINNLRESSTFGRMIAEHVSSRLSQKGFQITDMRLRNDSVFMEEGAGEFLLSRDLKEVSKNHKVAAVVVGTYGESADIIYVSAKIINPTDGMVISSCDYGFFLGRGAKVWLTKSSSVPSQQ